MHENTRSVPETKLDQENSAIQPNFFALGGLVFRTGIYYNDMSSDVKVIQELSEFQTNYTTPTFSQFFKNKSESINALEKFFLEKFTNYGLPVLTEPCELLDLVDDIPRDIIPLYEYMVINVLKIHWNPNRNIRVKNKRTNATYQLYDIFDVATDVIDIYENKIVPAYSKSIKNKNLKGPKPSDTSKIINDIIEKMKKGKKGLDTASSGFISWFIPSGWGIAEIKP